MNRHQRRAKAAIEAKPSKANSRPHPHLGKPPKNVVLKSSGKRLSVK